MEAEIGIIGGSGLYSLIENGENIYVDTPYGKPSDSITVGKFVGKSVAFLPRHGRGHSIPPHKVPFKANIEALAKLGVKKIIATAAVGSLKEEYAPGNFVLFDQFVNMTQGRQDTYFDQNIVAHLSMAEPYCEDMRKTASGVMKEMGMKYHEKGTVVVINGPRFSTKSESRLFSSHGFETINMTQYPEAYLAREKTLCYLGIGMVTDYDVGLEGREDIKPVTNDEVMRVFGENVDNAKKLVAKLIPKISSERNNCKCKDSLQGAVVTH